MKGKFYGVSVGPGDPEYMTLKAVRVLNACPVVAAPRTGMEHSVALSIARGVVDLSAKELLFLDFLMSRNESAVAARYDELAALVTEKLDGGQDVAMLSLGDASLYATHSYLQERIAQKGYQTETVAGVTSFCACAAALKTSLTSPRVPLRILPGDYPALEAELKAKGSKVIMKTGKELEAVKLTLKRSGVYDKASMVADCGMESEAVYHSLDNAAGGYFATILVKE